LLFGERKSLFGAGIRHGVQICSEKNRAYSNFLCSKVMHAGAVGNGRVASGFATVEIADSG
jgi:hypothetical protein